MNTRSFSTSLLWFMTLEGRNPTKPWTNGDIIEVCLHLLPGTDYIMPGEAMRILEYCHGNGFIEQQYPLLKEPGLTEQKAIAQLGKKVDLTSVPGWKPRGGGFGWELPYTEWKANTPGKTLSQTDFNILNKEYYMFEISKTHALLLDFNLLIGDPAFKQKGIQCGYFSNLVTSTDNTVVYFPRTEIVGEYKLFPQIAAVGKKIEFLQPA